MKSVKTATEKLEEGGHKAGLPPLAPPQSVVGEASFQRALLWFINSPKESMSASHVGSSRCWRHGSEWARQRTKPKVTTQCNRERKGQGRSPRGTPLSP